MLKTSLALASLMFVQYLGIGMYNIQLYTILSRPSADGGLGLEAGQVATVAVLGSLATLPALVDVLPPEILLKIVERPRRIHRGKMPAPLPACHGGNHFHPCYPRQKMRMRPCRQRQCLHPSRPDFLDIPLDDRAGIQKVNRHLSGARG